MPIKKFIKIESLSGILLFAATIIALIWANSSYGNIYSSLCEFKFEIESLNFRLVKPLTLWVNNGLMAIFFFVIEVKLKLTTLPQNINFWQIIGIASLGRVGFTMSIFIAILAFSASISYIDSAKVRVLIGSLITGLVDYIILIINSKRVTIKIST